jgi:thiamine-phosphate pyrophosphorylase
MKSDFRLSGLYAITDRNLCADKGITEMAELSLLGGARVIQYRDKSNDYAQRRQEALSLLKLCRHHGVPLLINDDVELAAEIGADGVHIGAEDTDLESARSRLGNEAIIGVSCYNRFELAQQARDHGADYIAFGRFFPSATKPNAVQATTDLLQRARQDLALPTVAIGGITPENGGPLIQAGADMLAVIEGIFGQPDVRASSEQFRQLFQEMEATPS